MVFAWIALAFYVALYFPLAIWMLRRLDRLRLPLALSLPIVWVSLEYLRAHFLGGFAWYYLGFTQHDYLPIIQIADLGGAFAVSVLVAAVNGMLFDVLSRLPAFQAWTGIASNGPSRRVAAIGAGVTILLVACSAGYGYWRLGQNDFATGPRIALIQTNIPQEIKNEKSESNDEGESARYRMVMELEELNNRIQHEHLNPTLIVWPETTYPYDWFEIADGTRDNDLPGICRQDCEICRRECAAVAIKSRAAVLLGMNTVRYCKRDQSDRSDADRNGSASEDQFGMNRFNSAVLIGKDGRQRGRYDKIHCVPFGEYVPARETCPWMEWFSPYDHEYSLTPGTAQTRLSLPSENREYHFGVLICYEDSDAVLARHLVSDTQDGPPADFLVNISNDGWFKGTEEHELHMAVCQFRAIETRRAVVRAVNMGVSGAFDGSGRVIALPAATWRESKKLATTVTADLPLDTRTSFYAMAGDWLAVACAGSCFGLIVLTRFRPRNP
jgi:apolipoprotein N-acyltransferase